MKVAINALAMSLAVAGLLTAATVSVRAQTYALEFVSTAAGGAVMDPAGSIIAGWANLAPTCTGCPPTFSVPSLWVGGKRFTLSVPANRAYLSFAGINAQGWLIGTSWDFSSTVGTATLWKVRPDQTGFDMLELPTLPGRASASATGIDNQGRVVGVSNTWFTAPDEAFIWTQAGGMLPLTSLGHSGEKPLGISPGGTVATASFTYLLGQPSTVQPVAPSPPGWNRNSIGAVQVNDRGDRAFTMLTTAPSNPLAYMFRYQAVGIWQQIGFGGSGMLSSGGVGAIDPVGTVVGTELSQGVRAAGPDGTAVTLTSLLSPAYAGTFVNSGNDLATDGAILASTTIGRASRLTRMVPVQPCVSNCLRVGSLVVSGKIVYEPRKPGQCTTRAKTTASAQVKVVDASGQPVRGAVVNGRFLDDNYLDGKVSLTTNLQGVALAQHSGPACVGAIAFFVDSVSKSGFTLDRSTGTLTSFVVPQ